MLRGLRKRLADGRGVPYVIFGDVALRQMARRYPGTDQDFLRIPGVGQNKLKQFGANFMQVIDEWCLENDPREFLTALSIRRRGDMGRAVSDSQPISVEAKYHGHARPSADDFFILHPLRRFIIRFLFCALFRWCVQTVSLLG